MIKREIKTIQINGKTFVTGLFWQPLSQNVKALGTELGMQYMIVRHTSMPQAGFVEKNISSVKVGDYSLAAVVTKSLEMEQIGSNWIAVIPIPESTDYYYMVMTEDVIRPYGEFIGTFEEVKEQFKEDFSLTDWNLIIAPKEFEIPNADERSLLSFFPTSNGKIKFHSWWRLTNVQNISNHQLKVISTLLIFTLLGGGGGYYFYDKNKKEKELERYRLQQMALKAQQGAIASVKPWHQMPTALHNMNKCIEHINKYDILFNQSDLKVEKVTCTQNTITFAGKRQLDSLLQLEGNDLVFQGNGEKFEYKEGLILTNNTTDEEPYAKNEIIQYFTRLAKLYQFINTTIVEGSSSPVIGQTAASSSIKKIDVNFDYKKISNVNEELPKEFLELSTLRLKKIEYTLVDNQYQWHVEGEIYVK